MNRRQFLRIAVAGAAGLITGSLTPLIGTRVTHAAEQGNSGFTPDLDLALKATAGQVPILPGDPTGVWQTMIFTTLVLAQMGNAMAIRSNTESVFKIGLFSNRTMVIAIVATVLLQLALIYIPFLQQFFGTQPLAPQDLAIAFVVSLVVFVAVEGEKWIRRVIKRRQAET